ncbi:MAG: hypothetical protein KDD27_07005 [Saprospiraceae bacterium]|nr:hypothetical protein [Saprospiraceae bacterium]
MQPTKPNAPPQPFLPGTNPERPAAAAPPQQERRFGTPPLLFKLDRFRWLRTM